MHLVDFFFFLCLSSYPYQGRSMTKEILQLIMGLSDTCRLKWAVPTWESDQPYLARGSMPRNNQISIFKMHTVASGQKWEFMLLLYVIMYSNLLVQHKKKKKKNCTFYLYVIFYVNQSDYLSNFLYFWLIDSLISWLSYLPKNNNND